MVWFYIKTISLYSLARTKYVRHFALRSKELITSRLRVPPSPLGKAKLESANIDDSGKAHRTKSLSAM